MHPRLMTALILLSAIVCYALGWATGATVLLIFGGGLELWFWVRVVRSTTPPVAHDAHPPAA